MINLTLYKVNIALQTYLLFPEVSEEVGWWPQFCEEEQIIQVSFILWLRKKKKVKLILGL